MNDSTHEDDDMLDGCSLTVTARDVVTDDEADLVVLFAGVPEDEVEDHAAALREVLA